MDSTLFSLRTVQMKNEKERRNKRDKGAKLSLEICHSPFFFLSVSLPFPMTTTDIGPETGRYKQYPPVNMLH